MLWWDTQRLSMGPNITSADNNRWKCRRNKVVPINLAARSVRTTRIVLRNIWTKMLTEFQIIYKSHLLLAVFVQIIHLRPNSVHCFMWWICNPLQNACNANHTLHLQKNSRRNKKNSPSYVVQEIVAMTRQMQMHNKVTEFGETNCSFQRLDPLEHDY